MKTDLDIIKECLKGDQRSCKQLYEKYISYCYGICLRYSVQQSELKDMVQVIFSEMFKSLANFDSNKAQFKTWFTRICINNILSDRKKQIRTLQTQSLDALDHLNEQYAESEIEQNIDKEYILSVLKKMPANYQVVFNLFIIDGYSHEEIAEQLDITVASSRVTLNRARNWVKKTFVNHLTS